MSIYLNQEMFLFDEAPLLCPIVVSLEISVLVKRKRIVFSPIYLRRSSSNHNGGHHTIDHENCRETTTSNKQYPATQRGGTGKGKAKRLGRWSTLAKKKIIAEQLFTHLSNARFKRLRSNGIGMEILLSRPIINK